MSHFVRKLLYFFIALAIATACGGGRTGITALRVSKDIDGKFETTAFRGGDLLFANAIIENVPTKGKTVFYIKNEKGEILPNTEFTASLTANGVVTYKIQVAEKAPGGRYILTADMHDGNGEKKDTKNVNITIEGDSMK